MDFVSGDGENVAADLFHVDGVFSRGLDGVGVKKNVGFGGDLADLFHILQNAGLVVGHHDGNELGVGFDSLADFAGIDFTARIHGNKSDFTTHLRQPLAAIHHGAVLDGGGNNVLPPGGQPHHRVLFAVVA